MTVHFLNQLSESEFHLLDHAMGFTPELHNAWLDRLADKNNITVLTEYIFDDRVRKVYPHLKFKFDYAFKQHLLGQLKDCTQHQNINYQNFICSFNGAYHMSREFLVLALHKFGWYNPDYCSKNFTIDPVALDGHITRFVGDNDRFYNKFLITQDSVFYNQIDKIDGDRNNHVNNFYAFESKITKSFINLVSESLATHYYPIPTEKFLYSIVTRGLFLAYAQHGYHDHLERYFGFKKYTRIFDYQFDAIPNPIERLIELMSMISKFSKLSIADWTDLYLMEMDTVEYNYQHYFSGAYLKCMQQHHL